MLTQLPDVVLDAFLGSYVSDQDLRAIHQVSTGWKGTVESRSNVNSRRLALVKQIRQERENIRDPNRPGDFLRTDSNKIKRVKEAEDTGKPGSRTPLNTTNTNAKVISGTSATAPPQGQTATAQTNSSTPKSRFQRRIEAVGKLIKGQVLFSCPDCKSPVPSPISRLKLEAGRPTVELMESAGTLGKVMEPAGTSEKVMEPEGTPKSAEDSGISVTSSSAGLSALALKSPDPTCEPIRFVTPEAGYINISVMETPPVSPYEPKPPASSLYSDISSISLCDQNGPSVEVLREAPNVSDLGWSRTGGTESRISSWLSFTSPLFSFSSVLAQPSFSSSSPSQLQVSGGTVAEVTSESDEAPYVVECPDCSYRFCSRCEFKEHPGQPCRLIGALDESPDGPSFTFKSPGPKGKPGCSNGTFHPRPRRKHNKKASLRRLANL